jgi:hypothetical protein
MPSVHRSLIFVLQVLARGCFVADHIPLVLRAFVSSRLDKDAGDVECCNIPYSRFNVAGTSNMLYASSNYFIIWCLRSKLLNCSYKALITVIPPSTAHALQIITCKLTIPQREQ